MNSRGLLRLSASMWLHRKKKKGEYVGGPAPTADSTDSEQKAKPPLPPREETIKSGSKKVMQFGARVQRHGMGSVLSVDSNFPAKELSQVEETKQRLFPSQPPLSVPPLSSSLGPLNLSPPSQFSPSMMSSESAASSSGAPTTVADFAFDTPKEFNIPGGLHLPALAAVQVDVRDLVLRRDAAGDFGFKIRRIRYPLSSGVSDGESFSSSNNSIFDSVVFAEPEQLFTGPPRLSDLAHALMPGDRLLEVNGRSVDAMSWDDLQLEMAQCGQEIRLKVRAMPELAEFCRQKRDTGVEECNNDKEEEGLLQLSALSAALMQRSEIDQIPDEERYWLIHSRGYTLCRLLERMVDGKCRIRIGNDAELVVDSSDVDHANSTTFDRVADVASLKYVNETSVIHLLRQRYGSNLFFTGGGAQHLVYFLPMFGLFNDDTMDAVMPTSIASLDTPENRNLAKLFAECTRSQMPAHIYALAQQMYRKLQTYNQHQSVVFTGVTGSGKSSQLRNFIFYLSTVASKNRAKRELSLNSFDSAFEALDSFGSAKTSRSVASTRFVKLVTFNFDNASNLRSAKLQCYLLETSRLLLNTEKSHTFNVFYYLWHGAGSELQTRLQLNTIEVPFMYTQDTSRNASAADYKEKWGRLLSAFRSLDFTDTQIDGVCCVLAAILHLSHADATQGAASKSSFVRAANAEIAAQLLGVEYEKLCNTVFRNSTASTTGLHSPAGGMGLDRLSMANRSQSGQEALSSFIQALYSELFAAIETLTNLHLAKQEPAGSSLTRIVALDVPGGRFGGHMPASLSDLVFNYVNERLSEQIHTVNFLEPFELYAREQIQIAVEKPLSSPHPLIRLLDRKQHLLNCTNVERRSTEARGLFYILEEECLFPGATDDSFFERLFIHFEQNRLIRRHSHNRLEFTLAHCLSVAPTTYSVRGWLKHAQPSTLTAVSIAQLLRASGRPDVAELFAVTGITGPLTSSSSSAAASRLRRSTQAVQFNEHMGGHSGGFFANISLQIDHFLGVISRQNRFHFVHCVQPQKIQTPSVNGIHTNGSAASSALRNGANMTTVYQQGGASATVSAYNSVNNGSATVADVLDISYVRQQIRPIFFVDSVRANNRGYPERMAFLDFRRRFQCLVEDGHFDVTKNGDDSEPADQLLMNGALDDRTFVQRILERMNIFEHRYRLGLSQILLRNDVLVELEERRDFALSGLIVALQRQARAHLSRRWLARRRVQEVAIRCIQRNARVHLHLRKWPWWGLYTKVLPLLSVASSDEKQREWRDRVAQLELTLNELRSSKQQLEAERVELTDHLNAECTNAQQLSMSLQREHEARVQLEAELCLLQQQQQQEKQQQNTMNTQRGVDGSQSGEVAGELDWENHEKTLALKAELSKFREHEISLKLKNQKATEQLLDMQAELETLRSENEFLKKRQKNFNQETKDIRDRVKKLVDEKEQLEKKCFDLNMSASMRNSDILSLKEENAEIRGNLSKARRELDDISEARPVDGVDCEEMAALRKAKRDLEAKVADLEGELLETVERNQMLEQNVTRLEMSGERARSDASRELDAKETEISELRAQYHRRLRTLEDQINDLSDANNSLARQNRILESRARQLDSQSQASSADLSGLNYKRELRKTLALLRDTQSVLAHERETAPNQSVVRQLKEQLEDADAARLQALKSRHSMENEILDLRNELELANAAKSAAEDKVLVLMREKNSAAVLAQEHDEQLQELLKKHKAQIQQSHVDSIKLADQIEQISDLERSKQKLQEQLNEAAAALEFQKLNTVDKHKMQLMELRLRDTQAKLDLEASHRLRFESIVAKMREEVECLQEQLAEARSMKDRELEAIRRSKKESFIQQEQINELRKRETELTHRYKTMKTTNETLSKDHQKVVADLKLTMKRIDALQAALNADLTAGSDIEEEDEDDFDDGGDSSPHNSSDNTTTGGGDGGDASSTTTTKTNDNRTIGVTMKDGIDCGDAEEDGLESTISNGCENGNTIGIDVTKEDVKLNGERTGRDAAMVKITG